MGLPYLRSAGRMVALETDVLSNILVAGRWLAVQETGRFRSA
ncbi:hypothetical protein [Sabulicella rubraurantiaca]|nr:hypothetical protein [Sabulicella rubraurantiaca]